MRLWLALVAVIPACGFQSSGPADGNPIGGGDDGPDPIDGGATCYGDYMKFCFTAKLPTTAPDFAAGEINTDNSPLCNPNHDKAASYCVIAGPSFEIPGTLVLRASGSIPLVLLSTDRIDIRGTLDVSSSATAGGSVNPNARGAGAALTVDDCTYVDDPKDADGSSGGFGGTFGGTGGRGQQLSSEKRGEPGDPAGFPPALRGGCPGGAGAGSGGAGGLGGGAVAILANVIQLDNGVINASGAGGGGGPTAMKSGGGGGGSGGMIFLEAATLTRTGTGRLFASGGGGGEGGAGNGAGESGGVAVSPALAAVGGLSASNGGNGGDGSVGTFLTGTDSPGGSQGDGGGGGGGGGAGFIHAPGIVGIALIAPPSTDPSGSQ